MTFDQFDVVVIPFPFTESRQSKRRPAVVVSSAIYQKKNKHLTLLMITSAKHSKWHGDINIRDLASAGLSTASVIRQKLFTIDERLVEKRAGQLSAIDRKELGKALTEHLFEFARKK